MNQYLTYAEAITDSATEDKLDGTYETSDDIIWPTNS